LKIKGLASKIKVWRANSDADPVLKLHNALVAAVIKAPMIKSPIAN